MNKRIFSLDWDWLNDDGKECQADLNIVVRTCPESGPRYDCMGEPAETTIEIIKYDGDQPDEIQEKRINDFVSEHYL